MSIAPSPLLALRSSGMVTAIGNSTAQTAASWMAQARRLRKVRLDGFADPFTVIDCVSVTAELHGADRLAALLPSAVAEAIERDPGPFAKAGTQSATLEILILPPSLSHEDCERLSLEMTTWEAMAQRERLIVTGGASAAWVALEHAYRAMEGNPHLQTILIAAVDSPCDPATMLRDAHKGMLLYPGNPDGVVPGEAAACVVLERVANADAIPAGSFAIHRPALVQAAGADAAALVQALSGALTQAAMEAIHISQLESDMDGSEWRGLLEAAALNRVIFSHTDALPQWRPASLLGQVGAAGGLIGWALPAELHANRIELVNTVLHWAVEPEGACAACVIERSPH